MYKSGVYEPFRIHQDNPNNSYHSVKLLGWGIENEVPYWVKSLFQFIYIK
jgi:hypothetical protein